MPRVVLPARRHFRSMARPGKSCGCRAIAIGRIPIWSLCWSDCPSKRTRLRAGLDCLSATCRNHAADPMLTGHASHQVGLDADIWLTPMPNRELSRNEREEMSAIMMVRADRLDIDPNAWTPNHLAVIRAAAQEPSVQRIFVNAAIKKALCREAKGDRNWLSKVRPMYGHDYHFHLRIKCPPGSSECESQPEPSADEGCSAGDLAYWFKDSTIHPKPPKVPPKPKPTMTLAQLPAACRS